MNGPRSHGMCNMAMRAPLSKRESLVFRNMCGEPGWSKSMQERTNGNLTVQRYTLALLYQVPRFGQFQLSSLVQEYVCTQRVRSEAIHFESISACAQPNLREANQDEMDEACVQAVNEGDNENPCHVGRMHDRIPETFAHSDRWVKRKLGDSMALCNRIGPPDLMLTLTCNPNWPEITSNLLPGQTASDNPWLTTRVFHFKMELLRHLIAKDMILGPIDYYLFTIEWQKRGA